jgi:DNA-binding beta-propeller fold protein YncE
MKIRFAVLLLFPSLLIAGTLMGGYHLLNKIPLTGDGTYWDYMAVDEGARRLYVSHDTKLDVIDLDTEKPVGEVSDLGRVHGTALAPKLGRGFVSSGGLNKVTIFDLKTLKHITEVPAGENPDGILYESVTDRVFAFNKRGDSVTIFKASDGTVLKTVELGGGPEFPVSDGQGNVWTNLEDKSTLIRLDARTMEVTGRWPVDPCEGPSSMAIDRKNRRLFIGCNNEHVGSPMMAVADPDSGKIVTTVPIGIHVDATVYEPSTGLVFNANNGSVTVIHQDSPDKYSIVETVETQFKANTMALDPKTHKIYLSTAEFGPAPAVTPETPKPVRPMLPGTFKVLVLGR